MPSDPPASHPAAHQAAGIDILAGAQAVALMRARVRTPFGPEVSAHLGHLRGLYNGGTRLDLPPGARAGDAGIKLRPAILTGQHTTLRAGFVNYCLTNILATPAQVAPIQSRVVGQGVVRKDAAAPAVSLR